MELLATAFIGLPRQGNCRNGIGTGSAHGKPSRSRVIGRFDVRKQDSGGLFLAPPVGQEEAHAVSPKKGGHPFPTAEL